MRSHSRSAPSSISATRSSPRRPPSGTLSTIRRHGAEVHGVPLDAEGIDTAAVRRELEALRAAGRPCKLIYTIVNFQNPAGPTMSLRRRKELVALAEEFGTLILEDDA